MWNYGLYNLQPPGLLAAFPRCEIRTERFDYDKDAGDIMLLVNSSVLRLIGEKTLSPPGSQIIAKVLTMSFSAYFSISTAIQLDVDLRCLLSKGIDPLKIKSFDDFIPCKGTGFTNQQASYYIYSMGGCSRDTIIGTRMHRDLYGNIGAKKREGEVMCGGGGLYGGKPASQWTIYTTNPCKWCCDSPNNPPLVNAYINETWDQYKSYCPDFNTFSAFRPIYQTYKLNSKGDLMQANLPIDLKMNIQSFAEKLNIDYLATSIKSI